MLFNEKRTPDRTRENEKRIALNHTNAKLRLLNNRISSAQLVMLNDRYQHVIRLNSVIKLKIAANDRIQTFQIAGVDEADIPKGKVAFPSPLAKVFINKKKGDKAILKRNLKDLFFEIIDITNG